MRGGRRTGYADGATLLSGWLFARFFDKALAGETFQKSWNSLYSCGDPLRKGKGTEQSPQRLLRTIDSLFRHPFDYSKS